MSLERIKYTALNTIQWSIHRAILTWFQIQRHRFRSFFITIPFDEFDRLRSVCIRKVLGTLMESAHLLHSELWRTPAYLNHSSDQIFEWLSHRDQCNNDHRFAKSFICSSIHQCLSAREGWSMCHLNYVERWCLNRVRCWHASLTS